MVRLSPGGTSLKTGKHLLFPRISVTPIITYFWGVKVFLGWFFYRAIGGDAVDEWKGTRPIRMQFVGSVADGVF